MLNMTRGIHPNDLEMIEQIPGVAAVVRDGELRLMWCTRSHLLKPGEVPKDYVGTTLDDILPPSAARERNEILRRVVSTGKASSFYQFSADTRVLCTIFPLDEQTFGYKGTLSLVRDMPNHLRIGGTRMDIPVMRIPNLHEMGILSLRELEVLYFVACGKSTQEIAEELSRATKTVEHHINSIHGKMGTRSRGQLVRLASERGIQSFSKEEWLSIVDGARLVRKEAGQTEPWQTQAQEG